jgi:LemA protein
MQWTWIVLGIVALLILALIGTYNGLVARRQRVRDAWANVDTELRRRLDLIPNVVETVKGYASHEREVFEKVTQARAAAEGPLTAALRQLFAVAEAYPDLKANQNFLALQTELSSTEDRIASMRTRYNGTVRDLNEAVQRFPAVLIARSFGFTEETYFEVEQAVRDAGAPKVDFSN